MKLGQSIHTPSGIFELVDIEVYPTEPMGEGRHRYGVRTESGNVVYYDDSECKEEHT